MSKYTLKNFLRIADSYVNADTTTLEGIEKRLTAWFCFTFNTTPNDSRLLDMTLEELLVLYQMHRIKEEPQIVDEELNPETQSYEAWLKEEMGDSYTTEEEMVEGMLKYEKEEKSELEKLPRKVTTDFNQLHEKEGIEKK